MAKLRAANAYRRIKRPYTRHSKKRKKNFIRGIPGSKIVMFDMGEKSRKFPYQVDVSAKKPVNLRHNAIEAPRQAANKYLGAHIKGDYYFKIKAIPHHVMRENPLATGAGADRYQQGMRKSFGKAIGKACRVKPGKILMSFFVEKEGIPIAKEAARKAISKFPIGCYVDVKEIA